MVYRVVRGAYRETADDGLCGCMIGGVHCGHQFQGPEGCHAVPQLGEGGVLRVGDAINLDIALLPHILLARPPVGPTCAKELLVYNNIVEATCQAASSRMAPPMACRQARAVTGCSLLQK